MESLVSHRAALESRGGDGLRRSWLKGKKSHELAHQTLVQSIPSAIRHNQAMLCLGTSKTGRGACSRLCQPWASAGKRCSQDTALPHSKRADANQTGLLRCSPLAVGSGCTAGPQVSAGSELCAGSSCQENEPDRKGDVRCEGLCHTHTYLLA